jgi:hypothetical protein
MAVLRNVRALKAWALLPAARRPVMILPTVTDMNGLLCFLWTGDADPAQR